MLPERGMVMVHEHPAFKTLIGEEVGYCAHDLGDNAAHDHQRNGGTALRQRYRRRGDLRGAETQFRWFSAVGCVVHPSHINRAHRGDSFEPPTA